MIKIKFIDNLMDIFPFRKELWNLLLLCDKDFLPSLSSRENNPKGPIRYFEELFKDNSKFILAFSGNKLVGFSIFYHNYYEDLISTFTPCNYIKIACVHPEYRGLKIASMLNQFIEEDLPENLVLPHIVRRTWSTNTPQLGLLQKYGYNLIHEINNDRGNNISTVYFAKCMLSLKAIS